VRLSLVGTIAASNVGSALLIMESVIVRVDQGQEEVAADRGVSHFL